MAIKMCILKRKNYKEILFDGDEKVSEGPFLQLVNLILYLMRPWRGSGIEPIEPLPPIVSQEEAFFLKFAMHTWLFPEGQERTGKKAHPTPSQNFTDCWEAKFVAALTYTTPEEEVLKILNKSAQEGLSPCPAYDYYSLTLRAKLKERSKQFSTEITDIWSACSTVRTGEGFKHIKEKRIVDKCYTSEEIAPLAWAEIIYAIENNIFARPCAVCHEWFPLQKGKYNQKYCSTECRSEAKRRLIHAKRKGLRLSMRKKEG